MENVFGENTKKLGFGMMRLPELATSGKFGNIVTLILPGCIVGSRVRMLPVKHW